MLPSQRHCYLLGIFLLTCLLVGGSSGCGTSEGPGQEELREARRQGAVAAHRADELRQLKREVAELQQDRRTTEGEQRAASTPPSPAEVGVPPTTDSRIPASGAYYGLARQRGTPAEVNKDYPIEMTFSSAGSDVTYPTLGCRGLLTPIGFRGSARTYRETIEAGDCDSGGVWQVRVDATTLSAFWSLASASYSVNAVLEGSD